MLKKDLLNRIQKNFPDLMGKSVRLIVEGLDHDVVILNQSVVFRFPKKADSKKLLKNEVTLLKRLQSHITISIPLYTYLPVRDIFGGYKLIVGNPLTYKQYKNLSQIQKKKLDQSIALFLSELHSTPRSVLKDLSVTERFVDKELFTLHHKATKYLYPTLPYKDKEILESFFADLSLVLKEQYKKVLVHGDLSGDHILLNTSDQLAGIIDFSDRAIHDPAYDFIFFWDFGESFVRNIAESYDKKYSQALLRRSKIYYQASAVWNMISGTQKEDQAQYRKFYRKFKKIV